MIYDGSPFWHLQSEWLLLVNNVFLHVIGQFLLDRCIEFYGLSNIRHLILPEFILYYNFTRNLHGDEESIV